MVVNLTGDVINVVLGTEPRAIVGVPIAATILIYLIIDCGVWRNETEPRRPFVLSISTHDPITMVTLYISSFALAGDRITSCGLVGTRAVADIEASRNKLSSSIMRRQLSTNFLFILNMIPPPSQRSSSS